MIKERKILLEYLLKEYKEQKGLIKQNTISSEVLSKINKIIVKSANLINNLFNNYKDYGIDFGVIRGDNQFFLNNLKQFRKLVKSNSPLMSRNLDKIYMLFNYLDHSYIKISKDIDVQMLNRNPSVIYVYKPAINGHQTYEKIIKNVNDIDVIMNQIDEDFYLSVKRVCNQILNKFNEIKKEEDKY